MTPYHLLIFASLSSPPGPQILNKPHWNSYPSVLRDWGLVDTYRLHQADPDRFSWYDYRAGMFHKNKGMRIDLLYGSRPVADRVVWAEIDREARKDPPTPSDHAPVVIDLDEPGTPIDAGWEGALARVRNRTRA